MNVASDRFGRPCSSCDLNVPVFGFIFQMLGVQGGVLHRRDSSIG